MVSVRKLMLQDKEKVLELGARCFREEDEMPLLRRALTLCVPELSFLAVDDAEIIGFTLTCKKMTNVYYKFMATIPNCYELAFLGVSPTCQGRGLGTRLLKETLLAIFQRSVQFTCWLLVDQDNIGAVKLYEKFGFRVWAKTTILITPVPGYIMGLSYRRYIHLHLKSLITSQPILNTYHPLLICI
jgi:ribosomal protein S18 acetylase RimI-like enzyme